jgi:hypothetical protein
VLAFGAERFRIDLPGVELAGKDARDLSGFLTAPAGRPRFEKREPLVVDAPEAATAAAVTDALARLSAESDRGELGQGDTVFVVLESHFLAYDGRGHLVGTDVGEETPPTPAVLADSISEQLGRLAGSGCRVVLLTDLFHRPLSRPKADGFKAWVRDLYKRRGVIVFVASKQGPSARRNTNRAFAEAVLTSLDVSSRSRLGIDPLGPVTLRDFKDTVIARVSELARGQYADCYVPDRVSERVSIFEPQPSGR